jgi:hypothetical protein
MNLKDHTYTDPYGIWTDNPVWIGTSTSTLCCFFCHRDLSRAASVNYVAEKARFAACVWVD